jgi:hypothetical protein
MVLARKGIFSLRGCVSYEEGGKTYLNSQASEEEAEFFSIYKKDSNRHDTCIADFYGNAAKMTATLFLDWMGDNYPD